MSVLRLRQPLLVKNEHNVSIVMETKHVGKTTSKEEQSKEMIHQYFEFHNQKDLQKIEKLVTPGHRFYFSGMPPMDWNGHKRFLTALFDAFPDIHFTIEDVIAEGDKVAFRLALTGTHEGVFQGVPRTGKKVSFGGTAIGIIVDGKLEENRAHADLLGLMRQLGAIPSPANVT